MDLEEMLRELSEKYKNSKSVEVYEEDLEWWFKIIDELREENKKLKEEVKELKETLEHRDSVLSIMYDLLRSDLGDYEQLCMIDVVIDVEVWNEPQNKLREELLDRFRKRDF